MLVVLMLLHVRLNVPDIFPVVGKYWVFVIMAVAFGGVGVVSETGGVIRLLAAGSRSAKTSPARVVN